MDNDEPTWPGSDFPDSEFGDADGADLGATDDGLPGSGLGYDVPETEADGDDMTGDVTGEDDSARYDAGPGATSDAEFAAPDEVADPVADAELGGPDEETDPGVEDPLPGTDPDADPVADDEAWTADPFPQPLDLDQPPDPVDGMPWSDPSLLGDTGTEPLDDPASPGGSPPVSDLYAYDGSEPPADGTDPWDSLAVSEDPATSSLARFWSPGT